MYAHLVVSTDDGQDLFTLKNMLAMCHLEKKLLKVSSYDGLCIQNEKAQKKCCMPWSIPNYISILNDRNSCLDIKVNIF